MLRFLLVGGLAYVIYCAALVILHPRYIYPFSQVPFEIDGFERRTVPVADAEPLAVALHLAGQNAPVVVYFMGNVGSLAVFGPMLEHHRDAGRTVVAMTFRGGGGEPGRPSEARLKADADALLSGLADLLGYAPRRVILHGFSLGTGLALHVAARHPVDGTVLTAPYTRICELMTRGSGAPACWLPVQRWDSLRDVPDLSAPVLVLHGRDDAVIPLRMGAALADAVGSAGHAVDFTEIAGGGHSDLMSRPGYLDQIDAFVDGP